MKKKGEAAVLGTPEPHYDENVKDMLGEGQVSQGAV